MVWGFGIFLGILGIIWASYLESCKVIPKKVTTMEPMGILILLKAAIVSSCTCKFLSVLGFRILGFGLRSRFRV